MSLKIVGLSARYGANTVLRDVSFEIAPGEVVALIGANGAGKSTLLNSLVGVHRQVNGSVTFQGVQLLGVPAHRIAGKGLSLVLEGRHLFGALTVIENLKMGLHGQGVTRTEATNRIEEVFAMFPILSEFKSRRAGLLSGGQQQMLAIGRALVRKPEVLLLDEPSLGLAPLLVHQILESVRILAASGVAVVLAEQNATAALKISTNGLVLDSGRVVKAGAATELLADEDIASHYLGATSPSSSDVEERVVIGTLPTSLRVREL